jgi:hypothetical protein
MLINEKIKKKKNVFHRTDGRRTQNYSSEPHKKAPVKYIKNSIYYTSQKNFFQKHYSFNLRVLIICVLDSIICVLDFCLLNFYFIALYYMHTRFLQN